MIELATSLIDVMAVDVSVWACSFDSLLLPVV